MSNETTIHVNGEIKPVDAGFDGVAVKLPPCEHDLLSVELVGIRRKNDDNYEVLIFGPKMIEKELPIFRAGVRQDRSTHMIHVMKMCREKFLEVMDKEISYQEEIQAKQGTRDAELAEDTRPAKITNAEDLPSAIITENIAEELKLAQETPLTLSHPDRYGVKK